MLVVMEMATGKIIEDEFGSFEDEVLNAEWQPPLPAFKAEGCVKGSIDFATATAFRLKPEATQVWAEAGSHGGQRRGSTPVGGRTCHPSTDTVNGIVRQ